jgi:hypothetical protein
MRPLRPGRLVLLSLPALGALACGDEEKTLNYDFPRAELSTEMVQFNEVAEGSGGSTRRLWLSNLGDLSMGVTAIDLGAIDKSEANFSVYYNTAAIECPETVDTDAAAKGFELDTGGSTDTGGGPDTTPDPLVGALAVLDKDCRMPIDVTFDPEDMGVLWGSLIIETGTQQKEEGDNSDPEFYSDPIHTKRMVYLTGEGVRAAPNLMVRPRHYDYGHLWTGTSERAYIAIENSGSGDLTVLEPYLDGCSEAFEITAIGSSGSQFVLEAGISTYIEVSYTPEDTNAASCGLVIGYLDEDTQGDDSVEVTLEANAGTDPDNIPPTVVIRDPGVGYQWSGGPNDSMRLELNIFDVNQPADSLTCRVKSMVKAEGASVAHCEAGDESGHVFVDVPYEYVDAGVDTIKVQVTDASQTISYASISVLWNEGYPESDDDGDGWGDEGDADEDGNYDCDDLNANTYPFAAEIADGEDNDCDGVADEGTLAYDDDGDSFSENDGDCNDYDDDVYPGAWEIADYKDNDCDSIADEGTSLHDDDGDGYTEMDFDCDDSDDTIHPGAVEYCDGVDNDCNGHRDYDDGCVEIDSEPYVVGGIKMQQTSCEPGDAIMVSVFAHDADGQSLDYAWTADEGLVIEPLTGSPSVTVTCPDPGSQGRIYGLTVFITDEDQNPVWDFDEMKVYPENDLYRQFTKVVLERGSCSSAAALPAFSLAWLAMLGAAIRRRRDD